MIFLTNRSLSEMTFWRSRHTRRNRATHYSVYMSLRMRLPFLLIVPLLASPARGDEHSIDSFEHHEDVSVELFAREPNVVDPVSLTFAANGDCFVVEMRDYPYGFGDERDPGGTIRLLRDRDGDGRVDESNVFAEGLSFPTSVMAWKDGILVVAPPQVLFLQDTNGDDEADVINVIVDGLRLGVTDSNANSLRWGIDNLIHVANGGNGGRVSLSGQTESISLAGSDFAFDPESRTLSKTYRTGGGFGLVFDDFGHGFTTYNINYLQQRVIPTRLIENSSVAPFRGTESISDHGPSARIFPIVRAVTRVNHPEQAGHFSSAGGMGLLSRGGFSERLADSVFVCDVVCNLVHRDRLRYDGPAFRARRAPEEQQSEFLASRDPAFRPVGLEHGPNGALYLLDMQRDVIEHPDYIPGRVRQQLDVRAGEDRGRIYRIVPADAELPTLPPLADADTARLVKELASPHRWRRSTAHRLLWQQRAAGTSDAVRRHGLGSSSPAARTASLWLLHANGTLTIAELNAALDDPIAGVRQNAVKLIEQRLAAMRPKQEPTSAWIQLLFRAAADRHASVRFQTAMALAGIDHPRKSDHLRKILLRDHTHKWSRRAVWLAVGDDARPMLVQVWEFATEKQTASDRTQVLEMISELASIAASTSLKSHDFAGWLQSLVLDGDADLAKALLRGLVTGWRRDSKSHLPPDEAQHILQAWTSQKIEPIVSELLDLYDLYDLAIPRRLQDSLARAREVALSEADDIDSRVEAIDLLSRSNDEETYLALSDLLSRPEPTSVQRAAIASIRQLDRDDSARRILSNWNQLTPGVRTDVIRVLLSTYDYQLALLSSLESEEVTPAELNLDLEQRRRLLRSRKELIRQRARHFFRDEEYANRKQIVSQYLERLPERGDLADGEKLYLAKCASCHVVGDQGHRVGPDLHALSHRSVEDLLTHILDPNMSINPNYVACVVETSDGRILTGLLAGETASSITVMQAEAKSTTIRRDEIEQMKTLETSLMPEGLEKDLQPAQIRSIIAYLQQRS